MEWKGTLEMKMGIPLSSWLKCISKIQQNGNNKNEKKNKNAKIEACEARRDNREGERVGGRGNEGGAGRVNVSSDMTIRIACSGTRVMMLEPFHSTNHSPE